MIRKIEPEEINDVLDVWIKASIQAHSFIDKEFWKSKIDDMREIYIPNSDTYIFKESEIIKGFFLTSRKYACGNVCFTRVSGQRYRTKIDGQSKILEE